MKKTINIIGLTLGAGGAEKVISLLLTKLIDDFNVNLILFHDVRHFEIPEEVRVFILDKTNNNSSIYKVFSPFKILRAYKIVLHETMPDISVSFLPRPNFLNTILKHPGTKIIISERTYPSLGYRSNKYIYNLYKKLIPFFYNKANSIFSNSIHINKDLKENFGVTKPMEVIYNPVLLPSKEELEKSDFKQNDIVWVGKLNTVKNPELLIKSLRLTKRKYKVKMLGEGEKKIPLTSLTKDLRVDFKGRVENVNEYISKSKCLVLTSNSEGFPNVILEGMAYGLPIIATNCTSGPLELLNDNKLVEIKNESFEIGEFGILVNVNDSIGLSKAIDRLLNDKKLYNHLSQKSLERVKYYSLDNFYNNFLKLINN